MDQIKVHLQDLCKPALIASLLYKKLLGIRHLLKRDGADGNGKSLQVWLTNHPSLGWDRRKVAQRKYVRILVFIHSLHTDTYLSEGVSSHLHANFQVINYYAKLHSIIFAVLYFLEFVFISKQNLNVNSRIFVRLQNKFGPVF